MQDKEGHHNSALFVQWVPFDIKGSSWEAEEVSGAAPACFRLIIGRFRPAYRMVITTWLSGSHVKCVATMDVTGAHCATPLHGVCDMIIDMLQMCYAADAKSKSLVSGLN